MYISKIFLLITLLISFSSAQSISDWKKYSNMKNVIDGVSAGDGIWAASSEGIFFYDKIDSTYEKLKSTAGFSSAALTAMAADINGNIWLGYEDGSIDVYDASAERVMKIVDIKNSNRIQKQINDLKIIGDTVFISTQFGLSLFSVSEFEFLETFVKLNELDIYTSVNSSFYKDYIYLCTDEGIVRQKKEAVNLSDPSSWEIFDASDGLTTTIINSIGMFADTIIAATPSGFFYMDDTVWSSYITALRGRNILDFKSSGDSLVVIYNYTDGTGTHYEMMIRSSSGSETVIQNLPQSTKIIEIAGNEIYLGTNNGITVYINGVRAASLYPNGPASNLFSDIAVDSRGRFWSASGRDQIGVGFYKLENDVWENYNTNSYSRLPTNYYFSAYAGSNGKAYMGNWGGGFTEVDANGELKVYTASNTPMEGIPGAVNYLVVTDFALDSDGNLWILNLDTDSKTLGVLTSDSSWYFFSNRRAPNLNSYFHLTADQYDTKWFTTESNTALYYFNENRTLGNTSDDIYGSVSQIDGLNGKTINCITVDKRGDLWIGTTLGANIITNTNEVLYSSNPAFRVASSYVVRQFSINAIAVDPINRKWVGTSEGLLLLSPDGTQLLASFDSKNSPLPVDNIQHLAVDGTTGKVYVSVDGGLFSFLTDAPAPKSSFSELKLYPSPFVIGSGNTALTIDGLVENSNIKIMTVSGDMIRKIISPGGRIAFWDGRDDYGDYVSSGIYFIIAYDSEGNNLVTSKVAVIRK